MLILCSYYIVFLFLLPVKRLWLVTEINDLITSFWIFLQQKPWCINTQGCEFSHWAEIDTKKKQLIWPELSDLRIILCFKLKTKDLKYLLMPLEEKNILGIPPSWIKYHPKINQNLFKNSDILEFFFSKNCFLALLWLITLILIFVFLE